jgi:hypothetical protein
VKKVEILSVKLDPLFVEDNVMSDKMILESLLDTGEYTFFKEHNITIEKVVRPNHDRFENTTIYYAMMDEQMEVFWKLKYK